MSSSQINPLIAKTPQEKMNVVCALAKRCFDGGVRLYIYTSEWKIAEYVNQLLWVHPKESFIPHAITREEIAVPIAIGTEARNLNEATSLLNLSTAVLPFFSAFAHIYEIEDHTSPEHLKRFQEKMVMYSSQLGFVNLAPVQS